MQMFDAFKAMLVIIFGVCAILPIRCFAQILKSIVRFVPVDVVNLSFWPLSRNIKPNNSMRGIVLPINFKVNITSMMKASCLLPNANFWSWFSPNQNAFVCVEFKKFCQLGMCNHASTLPGSEMEVKFNRGIRDV